MLLSLHKDFSTCSLLRCTRRLRWPAAFIMVNILLIGLCTGLDLEYGGEDEDVASFVRNVGMMTTTVFTAECGLKIVAEGHNPMNYFQDPENGGKPRGNPTRLACPVCCAPFSQLTRTRRSVCVCVLCVVELYSIWFAVLSQALSSAPSDSNLLLHALCIHGKLLRPQFTCSASCYRALGRTSTAATGEPAATER